jgi:hypothetical protein
MRWSAVLVVFLTGCGLTGPSDTVISVEGTVTDVQDGSPIWGATVSAGIMRLTSDVTYVETVSDEAGRYSLSFIEEGYCPELLFWLTGAAEGYREGRVTKRLVEHGSAPAGATHIRCTEELQTIDLRLEREQ